MKTTLPINDRINISAGIFLFLAVFAVYSGCFGHQFLDYDDPSYITANEAVWGFSALHLRSAFTGQVVGNYAPLHLVSYMLDHALWGLRPSGFILTNILLHATNSILLFRMLLQLQDNRNVAFFSAFLFALHPVQVESVAWITERKTVLAMFFFLLSLHAHIRYREEQGKCWYFASLLAFIGALLTKSVVVILPVVLLLYDFLYLEKVQKKGLIEALPYFAAAAACSTVALLTQTSWSGGGIRAYHGGSPWTTGLSMLPVFAAYLKLLFWPVDLSLVYMPEIKYSIDLQVAAATTLMLALAGAGLLLLRVQRRLAFWLAIFFLGLLPVSQLIPLITMMNDRYLYFPMLGAAPFCAGGIALLTQKSMIPKAAVVLAAAMTLVALPLLTWERTKIWQDDVTLWQDTVERMPESMFALVNLARAATAKGRPDLARDARERLIVLGKRVPQPGTPIRYDMYWNIRGMGEKTQGQ
jgi:protein O-mannosyl-transferase